MVKFILYLFESGLCLSLLYLVYVLFFRYETYFNFNRIYLLGIMILALLIPVIHVTIAVSNKDEIEETFSDIEKFRSYYTYFLTLAEGDLFDDRYIDYEAAVFEDNLLSSTADGSMNLAFESSDMFAEASDFSMPKPINYLKIFIAIYITGVVFFVVRLLVLLFWLNKTIKANTTQGYKNYKLVLLEKDIPPFSFFRYIFVNKDASMLKEYEQVLTHEQVHVAQLHSVDLIIAHVITVFQWFNPLVWWLQKSIKTTHEYIADSKVVSQGFELFDYQSLLLRQLVSIQSVELVNNFNLISIKKRIAMMTKNKSRFTAKLKALFIIPVAIVTFFLFADMTVKSPILSFSNFSSVKISNLDGIWVNNSDSFGKLLLFKGNNLSILETDDKVDVINLSITIKDKEFQFTNLGPGGGSAKYELSSNVLKIWWGENEYSTYEKTDFVNSFEAFADRAAGTINLPTTKFAKVLDNTRLVVNVYVLDDKYIVDGVSCSVNNLKTTFSKRVSKFNVLDNPHVTTRIVVDENTEMENVYKLYQVLRELRYYKIAYGSLPQSGASTLQYHSTGLPQMLPPTSKDAPKNMILDRDKIGDKLIVIEPGGDIKKKGNEVEAFIRKHPDYIAAYDWKNSTKYGDYLEIIDMFFGVIYSLRDELSMSKYNLKYTELPKKTQKEVRKVYPMRLSQHNQDEDNK